MVQVWTYPHAPLPRGVVILKSAACIFGEPAAGTQ